MANPPPQPNVYDSVNCDYEPPPQTYQGQNFGNPYDCPEGMYGGSMVSSVGYSKVSDHMQTGPAFNPNGNLPPNAGMAGPSSLEESFPGDTGTVIYKPDGVNPVYTRDI